MDKSQKYKKWQDTVESVSRITDKLGVPVDEDIKEMVAILCLFGFMTTASCGGHIDYINEGPYVMLKPKRVSELEKWLNSNTDYANKKLKDEIIKCNIYEQNKLFGLLKSFYLSHRPVVGRALTLRSIGYSDFRLNCQGSELAYIENACEKKTRLLSNRTEMKKFTEWLKRLCFEDYDYKVVKPDEDLETIDFIRRPTKESTEAVSELAKVLKQNIGIHTKFLYDGYFDGVNGGPYIMFESPKAEQIRKSVIESKGKLTSRERNELYKKAMRCNVADQQKLYNLLDGFYAHHDASYGQMLMIQTVGYSGFRLRNQSAEVVQMEGAEKRKSEFLSNCDAMREFTKYITGY